MAVSDRMLVLNDGEMEQLDKVEDIYDTPASKFVARFIGNINIVPGTIVEASDTDATIETWRREVHVPNAGARRVDGVSIEEGTDVSVGVRPSRVSIGTPDSEDVFSVTGKIQNRGYAGEETVYTVETEHGSFTVNTPDRDYSIGDEVPIWWPASEVYLFEHDVTTAGDGDTSELGGGDEQ